MAPARRRRAASSPLGGDAGPGAGAATGGSSLLRLGPRRRREERYSPKTDPPGWVWTGPWTRGGIGAGDKKYGGGLAGRAQGIKTKKPPLPKQRGFLENWRRHTLPENQYHLRW